MAKFALIMFSLLSFNAFATVIDLQDLPVKDVLDVYEQQRETPRPRHQGWIHKFEKASLGKEMDHLAKIKPSTEEKLTE